MHLYIQSPNPQKWYISYLAFSDPELILIALSTKIFYFFCQILQQLIYILNILPNLCFFFFLELIFIYNFVSGKLVTILMVHSQVFEHRAFSHCQLQQFRLSVTSTVKLPNICWKLNKTFSYCSKQEALLKYTKSCLF